MMALIVDDSAISRMVIASYLPSSVEIIEATDGDKAMQSLSVSRPDLLLLDLWMPRSDGWQVLGRLNGSMDRPFVVLITGDTQPAVRQRAAEEGVDRVVNKGELTEHLMAQFVAAASTRNGGSEHV